MKRIIAYTFTIIMALACSKEAQEPVSLSLNVSGDDATKVGLDDALRTYWNTGDKAVVFYRSTSPTVWTFEGSDGAYEGQLKYVGTPLLKSADEVVAVMPAVDGASFAGTVISLVLPSEQRLGGKCNAAPLLVAKTSSDDLVFGYATALVRFDLQGFGQVKNIRFRGNAGEALAGPATVDLAGGQPCLQLSQEATAAEITVLAKDDAPVAEIALEAEAMYVSVPPMTFEKGFTIEVEYVRGSIQTIRYTDEITLSAGEVFSLGRFEAQDDFVLEIDFNQGYGAGKDNVARAVADFKTDYGVTLPSDTKTSSAVYDMNIDGQTYRFELGYCNGTTPGYFTMLSNDTIEPAFAVSTNGWYAKLPRIEGHALVWFANVAGRTLTDVSSTEYFITTDVSVSRSDARNKCVSEKLMAPQEMGQEYVAYMSTYSPDQDYYMCLYAGGWLYMQKLKLGYRKVR